MIELDQTKPIPTMRHELENHSGVTYIEVDPIEIFPNSKCGNGILSSYYYSITNKYLKSVLDENLVSKVDLF